MSKQIFADGSVLVIGDDMTKALEARWDRRGNHDISCSFCQHENNDDEYCEGCTIADWETSCSCHINPPCNKCVGSKFEVSPYLINYRHHKNGRTQWECFKGDKNLLDKVEEIKRSGLKLSAEVLSTGEVAMYIDDGEDCDINDSCEICQKKDFREVMTEMIKTFSI